MLERFQQKTAAGQPMSFMDHLMELRRRLWVSLVAVIVCIVLSLVFYEQLIDFLRVPLDDLNRRYAAQPDYEEILKRFGMPPGSPEIVPLVSISPLGTMMVVMWLGVGAGLGRFDRARTDVVTGDPQFHSVALRPATEADGDVAGPRSNVANREFRQDTLRRSQSANSPPERSADAAEPVGTG